MAAERNKFHMPTLGTGIHGAAIRGVTTVNHPVNVLYFCGTWMKSEQYFFVMVCKNLL